MTNSKNLIIIQAMRGKEQETVPEILFNVVTSDDEKPVGIEFVAEPICEVEQLVENLPGRLVKGEVNMSLPKYGDIREVTFFDKDNRVVAAIPISHEQSVSVDEIFDSEEEDRNITIDRTVRYLTPSFRLSPAE